MQLRMIFQFFRPRTLGAKLTIIMVTVSALPAMLLGAVLFRVMQSELKAVVMEANLREAVKLSGDIESCFEDVRKALDSFAEVADINTDRRTLDAQMRVLMKSNPIIEGLLIVDSGGREVASTQMWFPKSGPGLDSRRLGNDLGAAGQERWPELMIPIWRRARGGYISVSDVFLSPQHLPSMTFGVPIIRDDRVHAVLFATTRAIGIRDRWTLESLRLLARKGGYACVVARNGAIVGGVGPVTTDGLTAAEITQDDVRQVFSLIEGRDRGLVETREDIQGRGEDLLSFSRVNSLGWTVVIGQSSKVVFSPLDLMRKHFILVVGLCTGLACIGAGLFSRSITRRLTCVVGAVEAAANGDLDQAVQVRGEDEIAELAASFQEMLIKLQRSQRAERLALIGELAGGIAHEVRNPLGLIRGFGQYLGAKLDMDDERRVYARLIVEEVDRINKIITGLLEFSNPSPEEWAMVDIHKTLEQAEWLLSLEAAAAGVKVTKIFEGNLPWVWADPDKLQQAFVNIMLNAIQAMPNGGELAIRTRVAQGASSREVFICFEDTGPGISRESMDKLFKPFYSTKPGGTGLGLSMSLQIVTEIGGGIEVRNVAGRGAVFEVRLPAAGESEEDGAESGV